MEAGYHSVFSLLLLPVSFTKAEQENDSDSDHTTVCKFTKVLFFIVFTQTW